MKLIEDLHAGKWVYGFDKDISQMLQDTETKCFRLNAMEPGRKKEREELIRGMLGGIGTPFLIHSPFRCDFGKHVFIGKNFVANFNLTILDEAVVTIGDDVFVGPNCGIYTVKHALLPYQRNAGVMKAEPVTIGNDVWLAANVTVLPGVTIGDGAVIGAGSVVTHDIPPHVLAAGNPCRVIRALTEEDRVGCMGQEPD
ncbi:MAG: sugar O-acetyltransferase [Bacteroidales bacterium]|nr:sugar O-acetyltransferase [Bacteroidales bacterium]MCM1146487.1 sugar O-acetyltransferase [Bacteroidales bacterium]MCM1205075.1 sugar O-acetyltransferase [Bacillota bacterium]MCM1509321.1 sugar O-acetyltransferase [Clostridium sp.]